MQVGQARLNRVTTVCCPSLSDEEASRRKKANQHMNSAAGYQPCQPLPVARRHPMVFCKIPCNTVSGVQRVPHSKRSVTTICAQARKHPLCARAEFPEPIGTLSHYAFSNAKREVTTK